MTHGKAQVFYPPLVAHTSAAMSSVFLAGTIDMGDSVDWQAETCEALDHLPIEIYNPRRKDWDSSWEQSIENIYFREQVQWELDHLEAADFVIFNFLEDSKSPVTMLELGIAAEIKARNTLVCCPKEFWRSGNVEIVCQRYRIALFDCYDHLLEKFEKVYRSWEGIE
jgi:hypothetical protein